MLTSLVAHPKGLIFGDLKQMCGLTDGNLSRHLHVLDEAGLDRDREGLRSAIGRKPSAGFRPKDVNAISTT